MKHLTSEELAEQIKVGKQAAKAQLKAYHEGLVSRYGYLPIWAGPFHYCFKCKNRHPNMCEDHTYLE